MIMRRALAVLALLMQSACQSATSLPEAPAATPAVSAAPLAHCPESAVSRCVAVIAVGQAGSPLAAAAAVTARDLLHSGQFLLLDTRALPQPPDWTQPIHYADWKALGVDYLILQGPADSVPGVQTVGAQGATLHVRLADVRQEKIILIDNLSVPPAGATLPAHQASDHILQQLTGVRGLFATDIAYVAVTQAGRASSGLVSGWPPHRLWRL
jgi:TolB protein